MSRPDIRRGFTLVELLVVIAILGFLATLTALYFPRFQEREHVTRGADQLQMWLVMARQQARRDGLPTGLRLYLETSTAYNQNKACVRRLAYIQQPEDTALGLYVGRWDQRPSPPRNAHAWFRLPKTVGGAPTEYKFTEARFDIRKDDYLELYHGGVVRRILKVNDNNLEMYPDTATLPGSLLDPAATDPRPTPWTSNGEPVNYRIIRQVREIPGEQQLVFPDNVGIDFNDANPANKFGGSSSGNRMTRGLDGNPTQCDLLFAPSGALIGSGTTNAQVILWVRDLTKPNTADILGGHATLVTVQPRTGFVAAHPAASDNNNPYLFTQDAKSSGM
ncbi:MAG: type II secretion system protein [Gemmataceae bacterium]